VATLETGVGNFGEAIEGTAAPPAQITTIPSSLNFGDVYVGSSAILDFDVGDQGGLPLTITESTPPSTDGFSALSTLSVGTVIAADTSIQESVQFAPTSTGPLSATWLVEGNDGNGVQTVTLNGTGVTPPPPPPSPPPTSSAAPPPPPTPALVITTLSGHVGTALALATSGGFAGGTVTYVAGNGTATGCQADGDSLYAASTGTCIVTASEAASNGNPAVSSTPTAVTFAPKIQSAPAPVTVNFASDSAALSATARTALQDLVKKLATDDSITCTGYAEGDLTLARLRAAVVADYLVLRVKLHVTVKSVTDLDKSATTVTTS